MFVTRCVVVLAITPHYSQYASGRAPVDAGLPLAYNANLFVYSEWYCPCVVAFRPNLRHFPPQGCPTAVIFHPANGVDHVILSRP